MRCQLYLKKNVSPGFVAVGGQPCALIVVPARELACQVSPATRRSVMRLCACVRACVRACSHVCVCQCTVSQILQAFTEFFQTHRSLERTAGVSFMAARHPGPGVCVRVCVCVRTCACVSVCLCVCVCLSVRVGGGVGVGVHMCMSSNIILCCFQSVCLHHCCICCGRSRDNSCLLLLTAACAQFRSCPLLLCVSG